MIDSAMVQRQLLDLPLEIQRRIYFYAVEPWDLTITWRTSDGADVSFPEHDTPAGIMHIVATPCFDWLTVCNTFDEEFRPLIRASFSGTLCLFQGQMIDYYPRKFTTMVRAWGKDIRQVQDSFSYSQLRPLFLQRNCIDWSLLPNLRELKFAPSKCIGGREESCLLSSFRHAISTLDFAGILDRQCDGALWMSASSFLDLRDLRILYRLYEEIHCEWTIEIDMRDTFPHPFLFSEQVYGDILRLHFRAPWTFVTSQYPFDRHENFSEFNSHLHEAPYNLKLEISMAYSPWYKEACESPNPEYFLKTVFSPMSGMSPQPRDHKKKYLNFKSCNTAQMHEDLTWPETAWMSNGELLSGYV